MKRPEFAASRTALVAIAIDPLRSQRLVGLDVLGDRVGRPPRSPRPRAGPRCRRRVPAGSRSSAARARDTWPSRDVRDQQPRRVGADVDDRHAHPTHPTSGLAPPGRPIASRDPRIARNPSSAAKLTFDAGWSSQVARRAHNPEVVGSNPTPATGRAWRTKVRRALLLCGFRSAGIKEPQGGSIGCPLNHRAVRSGAPWASINRASILFRFAWKAMTFQRPTICVRKG